MTTGVARASEAKPVKQRSISDVGNGNERNRNANMFSKLKRWRTTVSSTNVSSFNSQASLSANGFKLDAPDGDSLDAALAQVLHISKRLKDLPFDLADASVAETAARLELHHVLTIDSDFDVYRNAKGHALRQVLRDGWG